jgi:hypothetical protein
MFSPVQYTQRLHCSQRGEKKNPVDKPVSTWVDYLVAINLELLTLLASDGPQYEKS